MLEIICAAVGVAWQAAAVQTVVVMSTVAHTTSVLVQYSVVPVLEGTFGLVVIDDSAYAAVVVDE